MRWIKLSIECNRKSMEAVSALLLDRGIESLEINELPGERVILSFYINLQNYSPGYLQKLKEELSSRNDPSIDPEECQIRVEELADEDWATSWKEFFHCQTVGEKITVCPSWEDYSAGPDEIVIKIDPGMAFGTGSHATTCLMIRALEKYLLPDMKVLDVGCGSGILSIVAAKLGCRKVKGVDIDPDAVTAARYNVIENEVADKVEIVRGNFVRGERTEYELVVANLLPHLILELNEMVDRVIAPDGFYFVSGINRENADKIEKDLQKRNFIILEKKMLEDWVAFITKRRS